MAENDSFLRKVVRFVANPATDWTELSSRPEDSRELELEKSELKAMIERKRRNDFVRKREFDMLRRVRREGLSPDQLSALGGSSRLDDSEARLPDRASDHPHGVKAKIDAIEQQMVGDGGFASSARRGLGPVNPGPTAPAPLAREPVPAPRARGMVFTPDDELPVLQPVAEVQVPPASAPAPVQLAGGLPPLAPLSPVSFNGPGQNAVGVDNSDFGTPFAVEISEVQHDPELDEAVIAFANADFAQCEEALQRMTGLGGSRSQHAETWLVLFDLYRATGQQQRFESLALEYAQQFGWSAPQWYSLPRMVADAAADEPIVPRAGSAHSNEVGWVCPTHLDIDAVAKLRSQALQMPLPWVFDWSLLDSVDAEAATQLSMLFRLWSDQAIEMRWIGGERLLSVLQESAPVGVRDADPAFWQTRLDALRLANRVADFDEAAIDYCVTYEMSPPSWEPTRCTVHISGTGDLLRGPAPRTVSDVPTGFMESLPAEDPGDDNGTANVELSGQLVGDIGPTLARLQAGLSSAPLVCISCTRLIRVDFIAAGDLLNWVLSRRAENREVHFVDTHRLLALFFGAMGINEQARVQVRKV